MAYIIRWFTRNLWCSFEQSHQNSSQVLHYNHLQMLVTLTQQLDQTAGIQLRNQDQLFYLDRRVSRPMLFYLAVKLLVCPLAFYTQLWPLDVFLFLFVSIYILSLIDMFMLYLYLFYFFLVYLKKLNCLFLYIK